MNFKIIIMKKLTLLLLLSFVLICLSGIAQDFSPNQGRRNQQNKGGNPKEKIRALYIAYITQSIQLTDKEAEKFWPVHREYEKESKNLKVIKDNEIEKEELALNIKKKYRPLFVNIIGNERTNKFFKKDKEFRDKLIERLRDKRLGNRKTGESED